MSPLVAFLLLVGPAAADSSVALEVRVRFRVARCPGTTALDATWIDRHVRAANDVFGPWRIHLAAGSDGFEPTRCEILTRAHRDEASRHAKGGAGAVTVLVFPRVRDLDVVTYDLMGVHWRPGRGVDGARAIFLTARAEPPVLAHEIAHHFGLSHDPAGGNLMTPGPSSPTWKSKTPPAPFQPVLTADQGRKLRDGIARWSAGSTETR